MLTTTDSAAWIARGREVPPRAVLADPDEPTLAVIGHRLRRAGFEVETFTTGPAALDAILAAVPDVVVTASRLPGLDGLALFHALNERLDAPPPVVLVAWPGNAGAVAAALDAGVADVVVRPLSLVEVVARIRRFVR